MIKTESKVFSTWCSRLSEIDLAHSINGKSLLLPLLTVSNDSFDTLHKSHYVMSPSWKPNLALFEEMAGLIGIIDAEYNEEDVVSIIHEMKWRDEKISELEEILHNKNIHELRKQKPWNWRKSN